MVGIGVARFFFLGWLKGVCVVVGWWASVKGGGGGGVCIGGGD